jgi:glutamine amidotransferase
MACNVPTDIVFSFSGLALRGGAHGPHSDGWGLALYEGRRARVFLEPAAAATSALARHVREHPIKTLLAVAHVRRKTRGATSLANTHPFQRELWGRSFVFAHNGTLRDADALPLRRFRPMGNTDSEHAFCAMLGMLEDRFGSRYPPRPADLWEAVAKIGAFVGRSGTFNFLLADGTFLFARCDTHLCHVLRRSPFGRATLRDDDLRVDFAALTTPTDRVAVVATTPLTRDEAWVPAKSGTLLVFRGGRLRTTLPSRWTRGGSVELRQGAPSSQRLGS